MPKRVLLFKGGLRWILSRMDAVATENLPQSLFKKREVIRYPRHGQFHVVLQQNADVGTVVARERLLRDRIEKHFRYQQRPAAF